MTFIHPGDEDPPTPPSSAASPVLQVPAGLPTTPRRPATAPSTPSNSHSPLSFQPLQIRQSSQPSKAQQLYASAGNVTSPPSTGSEGAQRSLYRADQSSAEFDPVSLYGSPVSLSPTSPPSGSNLSPAPLSPNRPQFFQESFSRPQRRVGHSASFSAGYPFSSTATHTRDDSTTSDFRTRTLFQAAPTVESLQARKPPIDPAIRRNRTESALITMPYYNSSADTFQKPGGLPVYGSTNQPSAPTDTTMLLSPASSSPPLTSPGVPMTSSTTPLNSQDFYVHGVSAPGPVFVVPQGTSMPQLPGLASAPVTGQPPQTSLSSTGAPSRYKTLPNLPSYSHSGSISPQQMAAQPAQQPQNHRLSLPPGAAAPQMVPSLLPLTMGTAQAPVMPTQQYNYLPNGQSLSPPAVGSTPFQGVATMQMQGVPQQQFAPNPQQQQQDEARKKQTKILKKVGITLGKTALKVGAKAALGGMGVDQGNVCHISYAMDLM